jgi:hypothetical protein
VNDVPQTTQTRAGRSSRTAARSAERRAVAAATEQALLQKILPGRGSSIGTLHRVQRANAGVIARICFARLRHGSPQYLPRDRARG